jgi:hypothetical protein
MNGMTKRVTALETLASAPPCRTCAERPTFTMGGQMTPCSECGREPLTFTINIDRVAGREGDAA